MASDGLQSMQEQIQNAAREAEASTSTTRRESVTKVLREVLRLRKSSSTVQRRFSKKDLEEKSPTSQDSGHDSHDEGQRRIPLKNICVHGARTEDLARWEEELKEHSAEMCDDPEAGYGTQERRIKECLSEAICRGARRMDRRISA